MKLNTKLFATALACALILGVVAWAPVSQAYQEVCAQCRYVIFIGWDCYELLPGAGKTECYSQGPGCKLKGDDCTHLTIITA